MHNKQKAVSLRMLRYLLKHPVKDRSVEYNDNRISLFFGQYGRCVVTEESLAEWQIHCHHKKSRTIGGGDEYANLVIVSMDIHKLIHATNEATVGVYLQRLNLKNSQLAKVNRLREQAQLVPIL